MMTVPPNDTLAIPGTDVAMQCRRDALGRLTELRYGDAVYLMTHEGVRRYGEGLAAVSERQVRGGADREVTAAGATWAEAYRWDEIGRPTQIDGVRVLRDERERVIACLDGGVEWRYAYDRDGLAAIEGPHGVRHITHSAEGRPIRHRQGDCAVDLRYDANGCRCDASFLPAEWVRDEWGRLWLIRDARGAIRTTFLWDGLCCFGRIDGPPGDPLAAFFCLDPTGTPVRVIERSSARRIPRDAFGEGLLAHQGIPGLFGAAVYQNMFHYRSRALDPRVGAYHSPDPWHGQADDPRRASGYRGPLTIEDTPAGPYAVCRNDPIGRIDPTGEVSLFLVISTLTWAMPNNLVGILGLDLTVNFWGSLFVSLFTWDADRIKRFFSFDGLSAPRHGGFGYRRSGVLSSERAWTFQHIVWSHAESFEKLKQARAFIPNTAFSPKLYGTLLFGEPQENGDPFLLRGGGVEGPLARGWTRAGGPASPVAPGIPTPIFPQGGFHFDGTIARLNSPQRCKLTELEPSGPVAQGTVQDRILIRLSGTGLGLAADHLVLLSDKAGGLKIIRVITAFEKSGATQVYLDADGSGLANEDLQVRALAKPGAAPLMAAKSTDPRVFETLPQRDANKLDLKNVAAVAGVTYAVGGCLRLTQVPPGAPASAALIERFEARVQIDAPIPADLDKPFKIFVAILDLPKNRVTLVAGDDTLLEFEAADPLPTVGRGILVSNPTNSIAVAVRKREADNAGKHRMRVDRSLAALRGGATEWQKLNRTTIELGKREDSAEPAAEVTYVAKTPRSTTPLATALITASAYLHIEDNDGVFVVRKVSGIVYDAVVTKASLPGAAPVDYEVETFAYLGLNQNEIKKEPIQLLLLNPDQPLADVAALLLLQFSGPAVISSVSVITPANLDASRLKVTGTVTPPFASPLDGLQPGPGELVILQSGGSLDPVVIKNLKMTITLAHTVALDGTGLEAIRLIPEGPVYDAVQADAAVDPLLLTLLPTVDGPTPPAKIEVQMPRFEPGEAVQLSWKVAATSSTNYFRVESVERLARSDGATIVDGTTIKLEGLGNTPPATGATNFKITRMLAVDPMINVVPTVSGGASREGIAGERVGGSPANQVRFHVWYPGAFVSRPGVPAVIGIISGGKTWPVEVSSAARPVEIELTSASTLAAGPITLELPNWINYAYAPGFSKEGNALLLKYDDDPASTLTAGSDLVVAVPFKRIAGAAGQVEGSLSSGTVYIPADIEGNGLPANQPRGIDQHETLVTHELRHTQQYSRWGPLFFAWFPVGLFGDLVDSDNKLKKVSQLFTHGGLLNLVFGGVWGGLIYLFSRLYHGLKDDDATTFPATVESEGSTLRLQDQAGREALFGATRILVQSESSSVVRSARVEAEVITLTSPVSFTGGVRVAPYTRRNIDSNADRHNYFPATVDATQRQRLTTDPPDALDIGVNDRVHVLADGTSFFAAVVAVNAGGSFDLDDTVPRGNEVRVAKVADGDPLSDWDTRLLDDVLGASWIRNVTDPYGRLLQLPEDEGFGKLVIRAGRYLFSSRAWSIIPLPGWYFWDNMIAQIANDGVLSQIEQDASEESGNLYTPLSKLPVKPEYVGDIGRFWFFPLLFNEWSAPDNSQLLTSRCDSPGVHHNPRVRLIPQFAATGATKPPNGAIEARSVANEPGAFLPDIFIPKNSADPRDTTATNPRSFIAGPRGLIPTEAAIERCTGVYAAFTREGRHRLSVQNNIPGAEAAATAQDASRWRFLPPVNLFSDQKMQTILFDIEVRPVEVRAMGILRANNDPLEIVITQKLSFVAKPGGDRRYALTMQRPLLGSLLRAEDETALRARTKVGQEKVELSRVYRRNPTTRMYDNRVLNQHGVHLPVDIYIPIRRFNISVVDTIPFRRALSISASDVLTATAPAVHPSIKPGEEVFLLVPTDVRRRPQPDTPIVYAPPAAPPPAYTDPAPEVVLESNPPTEVAAFLAPFGQAYRIKFPADTPPEEKATLVFRAQVGIAGNSGEITATIELQPHFIIRRVGGGGFNVTRNSNINVECVDSGGAAVNAQTPVITPSEGITATRTGPNAFRIDVAPDAALRQYQILIERTGQPGQKALRTINVS